MKIEVELDEITYKALQNMAQHMGKPMGEMVALMLSLTVKQAVKMIGGSGTEGLLKMAEGLRQVEGVKDFETDWNKAREEKGEL